MSSSAPCRSFAGATIAQRFRFTLAAGESVTRMLSVTLRPANGIRMVLSRR